MIQGKVGVWDPSKMDDVIYEQPLTRWRIHTAGLYLLTWSVVIVENLPVHLYMDETQLYDIWYESYNCNANAA